VNRKIDYVTWIVGAENSEEVLRSSEENGQLSLGVYINGDPMEDWVTLTKDGREIKRMNVRYLAEIRFSDG